MTEDVLQRRALVLNRHWLAVHICGVRRALSLMYLGMAHAIDENYQTHDFESWMELPLDDALDGVVRSANFSIRAPEVIVLHHYNERPPRTVRFNRHNVFLRDEYRCQYCGDESGKASLTLDHVMPRSRGGGSSWDNVVAACPRCNAKKADRLPKECGMKLRAQPTRPGWLSAFREAPGALMPTLWRHFIDPSFAGARVQQ